MQDLLVLTRADFERLPDEGRWEVVEGWAILVPPWKYRIKRSVTRLVRLPHDGLQVLGCGSVVWALSAFIPTPFGAHGIQSRTPDIIVFQHEPFVILKLVSRPLL